ncbi:glycosyltransferase family 4 protein [Vibrio jasicida]|uniref:glycosyltransferase family 4 protein n=1 Tax=Vibrio jasicida TaxID=766224 RepID=UPI0040682945
MIFRIVGDNQKGGARRHVFIINTYLKLKNVNTLTFIPRAPSADPITDQESVNLDYRNTNSILKIIFSAIKYRNSIKLIHCHLRRANIIGLFVSLLLNKSLVITCHGPVEKDKGFKERLLIFLDKLAVFRAKKIIHISNFSKEKYLNYNGIKDSLKHKTIYNGSDKLRLTRVISGLRNKKTIEFVVVGELTDRKRIPLIISELKDVDSKIRINRDIKFRFYGDGPYHSQLLSLKRELRRIEIDVCGYENDLEKIYAGAHFNLIYSENEGFGRVITEAMSIGIPSIVSNSGAFPEIVTDGVTGIIVGGESLLSIIDKINEDEIDYKSMQLNCVEEFNRRFTSEIFSKLTFEEINDEIQ